MLWKKDRDAVRAAKRKDLERIGELRRQLHEMHHKARPDMFQKPFGDALDAQTRQMFHDRNGLMLVAQEDEEIVGFVFATFVTEPSTPVWDSRSYCRVVEIVVDKASRGVGYGSLLMQAVRDKALSKGCPKLELNVWAFNSGACAFWTKQGFTPFVYCMESRTQTIAEETQAN